MKLTREKLMEAMRDTGSLSRDDVRALFGVSDTTALDHLRALRDDQLTYIVSWREPIGHGRPLPLHALRVTGKEVDARSPNQVAAAPVPEARVDDRIVVRDIGLRADHVDRFRPGAAAHGVWAGLMGGLTGAAT